MYLIPNIILIIILFIFVIEFVKKTNSKLDILVQDYYDLVNENFQLNVEHDDDIKFLQQDFIKKLELLSHTDKDSFICDAIHSPDILTMPCFKPYVQSDTNSYNQELRFAKNKIKFNENMGNSKLSFDHIEHIICSKLATFLFENNYVKNKFNVNDGLVTFNLNIFNLIK